MNVPFSSQKDECPLFVVSPFRRPFRRAVLIPQLGSPQYEDRARAARAGGGRPERTLPALRRDLEPGPRDRGPEKTRKGVRLGFLDQETKPGPFLDSIATTQNRYWLSLEAGVRPAPRLPLRPFFG
jgi:hypothetical protein